MWKIEIFLKDKVKSKYIVEKIICEYCKLTPPPLQQINIITKRFIVKREGYYSTTMGMFIMRANTAEDYEQISTIKRTRKNFYELYKSIEERRYREMIDYGKVDEYLLTNYELQIKNKSNKQNIKIWS